MFTRYATSVDLSPLLILIFFLIGCSDKLPTKEIAVAGTPVITIGKDSDDPLSPADQMAIWVKVTGNSPQVKWDDKKNGDFLKNTTGTSTVFTAPDEPGIYTVDVIVTINGVETSDSVAITVVDSPTETPKSPETPIATEEITTPTEEAIPTEEVIAATQETTEEATPTGKRTYEPPPSPSLAREALAAIRNRGEIVVGVRFDAPPFGFDENFTQSHPGFDPETDYCLYHEDFEPIGFDVNLVREFAQRWLGDSNAVKFVPVPANKRIDCVENQRADLIAAAFTGCGSAAIECSQVYVQDLGDFLVRSDPGFEINDFCDISGKKVAVLDGTSAEPRINKEFAETCPNDPLPIFPPDFPKPATYTHRDDAIEAVENGVADMYVTDRLILEQYTHNRDLNVAGIGFGAYEFHMAVPANHQGLLSLLNQTLQAMKYDETYDKLYGQNKDDNEGFGCEVTPYDLKRPIALDDLLDDVKRNAPNLIEPCPPIELAPNSYTIQSGDTLYELAGSFYGDINYFECIQNANSTIQNPHSIQAGRTIVIPSLQECQQ